MLNALLLNVNHLNLNYNNMVILKCVNFVRGKFSKENIFLL